MSLWMTNISWTLDAVNPTPHAAQLPVAPRLLLDTAKAFLLVFGVVFRYASERSQKYRLFWLLAMTKFISAIGSLPFAFTAQLSADKSSFGFVTTADIGQVGMVVVGVIVVNGLHVDPKYCGSVAGVISSGGVLQS
ncbi:hypothetical protein EDD11_010522 [Mortierella claussenii]|nr:hypothetical protein EDD11_010522 [Mortierella claussenii]